MLTDNSKNQIQPQQPFINRQVYKNEKRKIRTRLFLLVVYHLMVIFVFIGFSSIQYLLHQETPLAILSDAMFFIYFGMIMFIFKYKNRKLLYTSMFILLIVIGTRVAITILQLLAQQKVQIASIGLMILSVTNIIVPWTLILYWDKLKDSKWRQTFDLFEKIYSRPMTFR